MSDSDAVVENASSGAISHEDLCAIREKVLDVFPEEVPKYIIDAGERGAGYWCRGWIIPQHIDVAIKIAAELSVKYGGDESICRAALLLHDTGLAYRRTGGPIDHEARSIEFASEVLSDLDLPEEVILLVLDCIRSTNKDYCSTNINGRIVRSADAMSQFKSMHFFAKASFFDEVEFFIKWFDKKVRSNFKKICFEDEQKELEPIKDHYLEIASGYLDRECF